MHIFALPLLDSSLNVQPLGKELYEIFYAKIGQKYYGLPLLKDQDFGISINFLILKNWDDFQKSHKVV